MNPTTNIAKNELDIVYSIKSKEPVRQDQSENPKPQISWIAAENKELLLMIPRNSFRLTVINKLNLQIWTKTLDLKAIAPSFNLEEGDEICSLTLSNFSRFISIFLKKGILIFFNLTQLDEIILERIHPTFRLDSFRFPNWYELFLFFASKRELFQIDPRTPFKFIEPKGDGQFLNQPVHSQKICSFKHFLSFDSDILDFVFSRVLKLFYVLLESNRVRAINLEKNAVLKKVVSFDGEPSPGVSSDICRVFPLLRLKRPDRVTRENMSNYNHNMRDFLLLLRRNGFLEVVRVNDFKQKERIPKLFSRKIMGSVDEAEKVSFAVDSKQHFCALGSDKHLFVFKVTEHYSEYNKSIHGKEFEEQEQDQPFFSEACVLQRETSDLRVAWLESKTYVEFMTMVRELQLFKAKKNEIGLGDTVRTIHLELDSEKINQLVSKKICILSFLCSAQYAKFFLRRSIFKKVEDPKLFAACEATARLSQLESSVLGRPLSREVTQDLNNHIPFEIKKVILKEQELFFVKHFPSATPNLMSLLSSSTPVQKKSDPNSQELGTIEYFKTGIIRVTDNSEDVKAVPTRTIYKTGQEDKIKNYFQQKYAHLLHRQSQSQPRVKFEDLKRQLISQLKDPKNPNRNRQYLHILNLNGKNEHATILGIKPDTFYDNPDQMLTKTFRVSRLHEDSELSLKKQKKLIYIEDYRGKSHNPIVNRLKRNISLTGMPLLEKTLFKMCEIPSEGEEEHLVSQDRAELENEALRGLDQIIQGIFVYEHGQESVIYYCQAGSKFIALRKFGGESGSDLGKILKEFKKRLMFKLEESKHQAQNSGVMDDETKHRVIRDQFGRIGVNDQFEASIRRLENELQQHLRSGVFKMYSNTNFAEKMKKGVDELIQHFKNLQTDYSAHSDDSARLEEKEMASELLEESERSLERLFRTRPFHVEFCQEKEMLYWLRLAGEQERGKCRSEIWVNKREDMKRFLVSQGVERAEMFLLEKRNAMIIKQVDRDFFSSTTFVFRVASEVMLRVHKCFSLSHAGSLFRGRDSRFVESYQDLGVRIRYLKEQKMMPWGENPEAVFKPITFFKSVRSELEKRKEAREEPSVSSSTSESEDSDLSEVSRENGGNDLEDMFQGIRVNGDEEIKREAQKILIRELEKEEARKKETGKQETVSEKIEDECEQNVEDKKEQKETADNADQETSDRMQSETVKNDEKEKVEEKRASSVDSSGSESIPPSPLESDDEDDSDHRSDKNVDSVKSENNQKTVASDKIEKSEKSEDYESFESKSVETIEDEARPRVVGVVNIEQLESAMIKNFTTKTADEKNVDQNEKEAEDCDSETESEDSKVFLDKDEVIRNKQIGEKGWMKRFVENDDICDDNYNLRNGLSEEDDYDRICKEIEEESDCEEGPESIGQTEDSELTENSDFEKEEMRFEQMIKNERINQNTEQPKESNHLAGERVEATSENTEPVKYAEKSENLKKTEESEKEKNEAKVKQQTSMEPVVSEPVIKSPVISIAIRNDKNQIEIRKNKSKKEVVNESWGFLKSDQKSKRKHKKKKTESASRIILNKKYSNLLAESPQTLEPSLKKKEQAKTKLKEIKVANHISKVPETKQKEGVNDCKEKTEEEEDWVNEKKGDDRDSTRRINIKKDLFRFMKEKIEKFLFNIDDRIEKWQADLAPKLEAVPTRVEPMQEQLDMQSNNLNSLATSTLVLSKNSTQLKGILNSIREDKKSEKELFNDMLKMMELHDEQMIKVVDLMQKQESLIQAQQKEISELKGSLKQVGREVKASEAALKEQNEKHSEKLDSILERLTQQRQEDQQRNELMIKMFEKMHSAEQERSWRARYPQRDQPTEFAYKSFGFPRRNELDRISMENMRLKRELELLEAEESENGNLRFAPNSESDDILGLLRRFKNSNK